MIDNTQVVVKECIVLEKFEGDILFEKMFIENGKIVKVEHYNNGVLDFVENLEE